MEEVLFESEVRMPREEIADYLHTVGDNLAAGAAITLNDGNESVTLEPSQRPTFEVKAEREGPPDAPGEFSIELEIEWHENEDEGGELSIE